jgi:hypothetical protein
MSEEQFAGLVDDFGAPLKWKFATLASVAGLFITICLLFSNVGAKGERLEATVKRVETLEKIISKVDVLQANQEETLRRINSIESRQEKIFDIVRKQ